MLRIHFMNSIIPGRPGVMVVIKASICLRLGPVRYSESFEESKRPSEECYVSDSFEQSFWMEILCIQVMHDVCLLSKLLIINVFNSETSYSGFLNMESVAHKAQIRH